MTATTDRPADGYWFKDYLDRLAKNGQPKTRTPGYGPDMAVDANEQAERDAEEKRRREAEEKAAREYDEKYPRGSYWWARCETFMAEGAYEVTLAHRDEDGDWYVLGDDQSHETGSEGTLQPIERVEVPPAVKGAMAQQLLTERDE
ncbi:MAG: hypothetical protein CL819_09070 [Croceicoccus sp.]|nr:hypothetical protein [Croceicoccus sp.]